MLERIITSINSRYGSKRAVLHTLRFGVMDYAGAFARYQEVDWSTVQRLVFICMGNICRSPLAEACARQAAAEAVSAGVSCSGDAPADQRAIEFAARQGVDLSNHRSTSLDRLPLAPTDLVVGMEPAHLDHPLLLRSGGPQCTLLGLWGAPRRVYIHDPYSTDKTYFDRCEQYVMDATRDLVRAMRSGKGLDEL